MSRTAQKLTAIRDSINRFFYTPYYIIAVAVLSLAAHFFSAELAVYTVFAAVGLYAGFLGNDLLPMTPLFLFCYILPSTANNPAKQEASVFTGNRGLWILGLGIALVCAMVVFFIRHRKTAFSVRHRLLPGMLVLCGAYMLSGIGSAAYPGFLKQNLIYCALQCACILVPYWLLSGGVRWTQVRKDYLSWIGICAGVFLLLQLGWCYLSNGVIENGAIVRTRIYTGWGMYNNIGSMLAMMLPFAFSLALIHKKDFLGFLLGGIFLCGILLTCSRASILVSGFVFILCLALLIRYTQNRKLFLVILFGLIVAALIGCVVMWETIMSLFSDIIKKGLDPHTRDEIYTEGIKLFKQAPLLGNSFFSPGYVPWDFSEIDAFSSLVPPRWCNTVVQLLVSAGVVGLAAYLYHRVDTLVLFWKRRGMANNFILCSIAALLLTSLLDCHFFNLGPVLFYSSMLAFAEHQT